MRLFLPTFASLLWTASQASAGSPDAAGVKFFEEKVRPVLVKHCYECHSAESKKVKGSLYLDSRDGMREGGASGPSVIPGKPAESLLIKAVRHASDDLKMPKTKLPDAIIADLEAWIKMGAPDPRERTARRIAPEDKAFWAFQKTQRPVVPKVRQVERVRTPVDAFMLHKLEAKGLTFAPDADRTTLIRRATFDLIGLPPSPEEMQAFVTDTRADAYERLIDRLLASPHFGERLGRRWLDAAGYVDITGGDNDAATVKIGEGKWRYRDYVVRAFNQDMPFDRFLTEQLAGDELDDWRSAKTYTPEIKERLIATGFLRSAPDNTDEMEINKPREHHAILQQTGEVVVNNLLALTLQCAKCHDHKFEPITQREYYRVLALFNPAFSTKKWLQPKERQLPDISLAEKADIEKSNADIDRKIKELKSGKGNDKLIAELSAKRRSFGAIQAVYDVAQPPPTFLLKRGNYETLGVEVPPGFLDVLAELPKTTPAGTTSGRRLALAHALTDPQSPAAALVGRVQVNRLWLHLFGRGLVETPDNLGKSGTRPTHPELLDWLTARFVHDDRRFKPLLRLLMTSTVYRQSSIAKDAEKADPDNHLLWRMRLRRLESESIRDALLAVSGRLDRTLGGPPILLENQPDGMVIVKRQGQPTPTSEFRRSIYLLSRRAYHPTLLDVFDQPLMPANCVTRNPSSVVTQSLAMLNDTFVRDRADDFANRVEKSLPFPSGKGVGGEGRNARVDLAFRIALGRAPKTKELALSVELMQRQEERYRTATVTAEQASHRALTDLCHMLLNTNEFLYVP